MGTAAQQLSEGPVRDFNADTPLSPKLFSILLKKASAQAEKWICASTFPLRDESHHWRFCFGSAALLALHPDLDFPLQNIDLYAPVLSQRRQDYAIHGFLESCGFRGSGPSEHYKHILDVQPSIALVQHFAKPTPSGTLFVNLFYVRHGSSICPIVQAHSTFLMNYIAWYGVVCLYPDMTLQKMGVALDDSPNAIACYDKYKDRGLVYVHPVAHSLFGVRRLIGDGVLLVPFVDKTLLSLQDVPVQFAWQLPQALHPTRGNSSTLLNATLRTPYMVMIYNENQNADSTQTTMPLPQALAHTNTDRREQLTDEAGPGQLPPNIGIDTDCGEGQAGDAGPGQLPPNVEMDKDRREEADDLWPGELPPNVPSQRAARRQTRTKKSANDH
ncbi:hypothetical protein CPC08DRAFT_771685 [Agrocybe pediades]|nr:hypothetical protein CPC08DRAFT_771685 [Agrocybe pediades]